MIVETSHSDTTVGREGTCISSKRNDYKQPHLIHNHPFQADNPQVTHQIKSLKNELHQYQPAAIMKSTIFTTTFATLLLHTSTSLAAPNAQPVKGAGLITGWSKPVTYCNYGWTGNGGCEAKGKCENIPIFLVFSLFCLTIFPIIICLYLSVCDRLIDELILMNDPLGTFCCSSKAGGNFENSKFVSWGGFFFQSFFPL